VDTDDSSELCYDDAWTVMMLVKLDLQCRQTVMILVIYKL
jgi:hypothetical protein